MRTFTMGLLLALTLTLVSPPAAAAPAANPPPSFNVLEKVLGWLAVFGEAVPALRTEPTFEPGGTEQPPPTKMGPILEPGGIDEPAHTEMGPILEPGG